MQNAILMILPVSMRIKNSQNAKCNFNDITGKYLNQK